MNARASRKLSDDDVGSVLGEDTFSAESIISTVSEKHITVSLSEVEKSVLNPRKTQNPKYHEIKESIRHRGLDQPPRLTKRTPDQLKWEIAYGGNSRLDILWDLHNEYKDLAAKAESIPEKIEFDQKANSFLQFDAVCIEWKGEINALTGHVVENEVHSPMLFIEKALAAKDLKDLFEKDLRDPDKISAYAVHGVKKTLGADQSIGTRPLARLITSTGWPIDAGNLSRYMYAATDLANLMPQALWAGAGHDAVARIKKIGSTYFQFLSEQVNDEEMARELFATLWAETLHSNDGETILWDQLRLSMAKLLSKHIDLDSQSISSEIDALLTKPKKAAQQAAEKSTSPEEVDNISTQPDSTSTENAVDTKNIPKDNSLEEANTANSQSGNSQTTALDLAKQIANKWALAELLTTSGESKKYIGFAISAPASPFEQDDDSRYIWWRLLTTCCFDVETLEELCSQAFGKNVNAAKAFSETSFFFMTNMERRADLKSLRKLEDNISESLVKNIGEG